MVRINRIAALIALGGGLAASAATNPAATAATKSTDADQAARSARSVRVTFINRTSCTLALATKEAIHGVFTINPNLSIPAGRQDFFQTDSNGILTGTEGVITYRTTSCEKSCRTVRFHWSNPYVGANSYDFNQTDPTIAGSRTGGSGNNALVTATVREL